MSSKQNIYIFNIRPHGDMFTEQTVAVDAFYEIQTSKYTKLDNIHNLMKLYKDEDQFLKLKGIPKEDFHKDIQSFKGMSMRAMVNGDITGLLCVKTESELDAESLEVYLNNLPKDELKDFIEAAKI